jgi:hypothetical protein
MPRHEIHPDFEAVGEVTHVFAHRFVVDTGSKSIPADLTPPGLEIVKRRVGDRIALKGKQKPSEIKVSKLQRNGQTFEIGHGSHDRRDHEIADPATAIKTAENAGYRVIGEAVENQSILRCWEKRGPNWRSFISSSTEVFVKRTPFPLTIASGQ